MPDVAVLRYEKAKWASEFVLVPLLHWLMLSHWYFAATTTGTIVLAAYMTASWHHAKTVGIIRSV